MLDYDDEDFEIIEKMSKEQLDFEKYATAQLPFQDILTILNMTEDQAERLIRHKRNNIHDYYDALVLKGKADLVCSQYEKGIVDKNTALLIHLGAYWANQTKETSQNAPSIMLIDDKE